MMKKRFLAFVLTLGLCLGLTPSAGAMGDTGYPGWGEVVSCGDEYTAAIKADGTLWMWGSNAKGQLGNGGKGNATGRVFKEDPCQTVPIKVMDNVAAVSCGDEHVAALKTDGTLWMWGSNAEGQLGNGGGGNAVDSIDNPCQTVPLKVMDNVAAVSCGDHHTAAVKTDGTLWMWGANSAGQLGNGGDGNATNVLGQPRQTTPIKVMDNVTAVSCGSTHTAILKTDGTLWMCGNNCYGALGNGGDGNASDLFTKWQTVPMQVMEDVASVSCGGGTTAAVKIDGTLWTWGENGSGQLGNGGTGDMREIFWNRLCQTTPMQVMDHVASVACGSAHTAILKTDGTLWTCGYNSYGKLGDGMDEELREIPVQVMDHVSSMACGGNSTAVIKTDGTLLVWGKNDYGQLGNGTLEDHTIPAPVMTGLVLRRPSPPIAVAGFTDVWEGAYYADAVRWAVNKNITSGTSATTFSPDTTCTTAQILTFLWRANGSPAPNGSNAAVPAGQYYTDAANWALEKGLTDAFNADTPATRAATVTYLWKLAGKPAADAASFADVDAGAEYAQAVAWAVKEGITAGTSATTFAPDNTCTRGQIVTFLYRDLAG